MIFIVYKQSHLCAYFSSEFCYFLQDTVQHLFPRFLDSQVVDAHAGFWRFRANCIEFIHLAKHQLHLSLDGLPEFIFLLILDPRLADLQLERFKIIIFVVQFIDFLDLALAGYLLLFHSPVYLLHPFLKFAVFQFGTHEFLGLLPLYLRGEEG